MPHDKETIRKDDNNDEEEKKRDKKGRVVVVLINGQKIKWGNVGAGLMGLLQI